MVHIWATICTAALAWASVVQGMSLVERSCPDDRTAPKCETSGGSPMASDCQVALQQISGPCKQTNGKKSHCFTVATWNSCKVDVCGNHNFSLLPGINCGGYLQSVLNSCRDSNGRVGGQIHPAKCNILFPARASGSNYEYRLQFSNINTS